MTPLCWESANPNHPSSECSGDVPKLIGTVRSAPKRVAVYRQLLCVMETPKRDGRIRRDLLRSKAAIFRPQKDQFRISQTQ